jgi:hypothetical protein
LISPVEEGGMMRILCRFCVSGSRTPERLSGCRELADNLDFAVKELPQPLTGYWIGLQPGKFCPKFNKTGQN